MACSSKSLAASLPSKFLFRNLLDCHNHPDFSHQWFVFTTFTPPILWIFEIGKHHIAPIIYNVGLFLYYTPTRGKRAEVTQLTSITSAFFRPKLASVTSVLRSIGRCLHLIPLLLSPFHDPTAIDFLSQNSRGHWVAWVSYLIVRQCSRFAKRLL